eukprot:8900257-Alexandrium_andersonii.AAC.1
MPRGVGDRAPWNASLSVARVHASCSASTPSSSTRQPLSSHAIQQSSSHIIYPSKHLLKDADFATAASLAAS